MEIKVNSKQKTITPTQEEIDWINNHNSEHAAMLWRYAAMLNTLDISWLDGYIASNATYASQSVFEKIVGASEIKGYLIEKFKLIEEDGNNAFVQAAFAELIGTGDDNGNACVAIYQAQSELDQTAWDRPICCMTLELIKGKITTFLMVTSIPSPINAKTSNIFPMLKTPPKSRTVLEGPINYHELCFTLFLLDGLCTIDVVAKEQLKTVVAHYSGAISREVITIPTSLQADNETCELGIFGFPSLVIKLNDKVLYKHTGLIRADHIINNLSLDLK